MPQFPNIRMRRLRRTPALRALTDAPMPGPEKFLCPVFVLEGKNRSEPIDSMPGQSRFSSDKLVEFLKPVVAQGIAGTLLFGVLDDAQKDTSGSAASAADGLIPNAARAIKAAFPEFVVATDVCLCAYTTHGHCGPLSAAGAVDNDAANEQLAAAALAHAAAGADIVAPSAMMDGQVSIIRQALDSAGMQNTAIMSYSTKFASSMYGPFREAERSAPKSGDRKSYQASYADARAALRESALDEAENADILMVKPALFYLDLLARLRDRTDLPIAAYNVSGEYAMLNASAQRGWGDLRAMVQESTMAMARAGADILISYWASRYEEFFK